MDIHKVRIAIKQGEAFNMVIADMVFMSGVPHVVLEWWQGPLGDTPVNTISLEPAFLHEFPKAPDWMYEYAVEDKRPTV